MLFLQFISSVSLIYPNISTHLHEIAHIKWINSNFLQDYHVLIPLSMREQYTCHQEKQQQQQQQQDSIDCYYNHEKILHFDFKQELFIIYPEINNMSTMSSLCFSEFQHGIIAITSASDNPSEDSICNMMIPIRKEISFDAYLFINWKKLSHLFQKVENFDGLICDALASLTTITSTSNRILLHSVSIADHYGNPTGFRYWLDRCQYTSGSRGSDTTMNLILLQQWHLNEIILQRSSKSFKEYNQSCPCILKKITIFHRIDDIESSFRGICLEQFFHHMRTSNITLLSLNGFKNLQDILTKDETININQHIISQDIYQFFFILQGYQSAATTADPQFSRSSLSTLSFLRLILTRLSEVSHRLNEFTIFQEDISKLFTSPTYESWMITYHELYPRLLFFSENYLTSDVNNKQISSFLRWFAEYLISCSPRYNFYFATSPCPILSSPSSSRGFDLIQQLVGHLNPSSALSSLDRVIKILSDRTGPDMPSITLSIPTFITTNEALYDTMFLLFIHSDHQQEAEDYIAAWRYSMNTPKHSYSYHIITMDYCQQRYVTLHSEMTLPCLRGVLLNLEQWMEEFSTFHDRIVVTIGIEALRSIGFESGSGLFISESRHIKMELSVLPSLIFAASTDKNPHYHVDIRAFAGFSKSIELFIQVIRSSPLYSLTEYGPLFAFHEFFSSWNSSNSSEQGGIYLDSQRIYFNMSKSHTYTPLYFTPIEQLINLDTLFSQITLIGNQILQENHISSSHLTAIIDSLNILADSYLLEYLRVFEYFVQGISRNLDILFVVGFLAFSRRIDYLDPFLMKNDKYLALEMLQKQFQPMYSHNYTSSLLGLNILSAILELMSSLSMNLGTNIIIGRTTDSILYYQDSYVPPLYSIIQSHQVSWIYQRTRYQTYSSYHTWYFTIATQINEKLENLLRSATIAGITIEVLGLGEDHRSLDKVKLYHDALHKPRDPPIEDHDVIVLLDGYDVILTPAARFIGQRLATCSTPMLYGAEVGLFPHITASWLHTFGLDNRTNNTKNSKWDSIIPRRYVNSGTFLGRAKETKEFYNFFSTSFSPFTISQVYKEEQHLITRYVLQHPEIISIDHSNEIFFSLYQFPMNYFYEFDSNFLLQRNSTMNSIYQLDQFRYECVAVIHGNGWQGKHLYQFLAAKMKERFDQNTPNSTLWEWWYNHLRTLNC